MISKEKMNLDLMRVKSEDQSSNEDIPLISIFISVIFVHFLKLFFNVTVFEIQIDKHTIL